MDFSHRKVNYKTKSTPPWKEIYKKNCIERLRERRASLFQRSRYTNAAEVLNDPTVSPVKVVNDIMQLEWSKLDLTRNFPSLNNNQRSLSSYNFDLDEQLFLEEIQKELKDEDESLLNEIINFDSRELESRIDMFQRLEVICPICKVNKLEELYTIVEPSSFQTPPSKFAPPLRSLSIYCRCGLRLIRPELSLDAINASLQWSIFEHGKNCNKILNFTHVTDEKGSNIYITCPACDWMNTLF